MKIQRRVCMADVNPPCSRKAWFRVVVDSGSAPLTLYYCSRHVRRAGNPSYTSPVTEGPTRFKAATP